MAPEAFPVEVASAAEVNRGLRTEQTPFLFKVVGVQCSGRNNYFSIEDDRLLVAASRGRLFR